MKTSLLFICALTLCYSCKKDDVPAIPSGKFESVANIENDPVVLYTKGKTITDQSYIQAFLERNRIFGFFDIVAGTAASPVRVIFDNRVADSVHFVSVSDAGLFQLVCNQVYYENNTAVFIGRDSLQAPIADDGELSCSNIPIGIRRHPLVTDCSPTGPLGDWRCKALYHIPLVMNGSNISVPIISYYFINKTPTSSCNMREKYIFDQFNDNVLKTIHTEDTLVVQTRTLVLEKK